MYAYVTRGSRPRQKLGEIVPFVKGISISLSVSHFRSFPLTFITKFFSQPARFEPPIRHGLGVQHVRAVGVQIQAKVIDTGYHVDVSGSCWVSEPTINHPAPAHQPNYFRDHQRSDSGSWQGSGPRQQHRDRGEARRVGGGPGVGTTSVGATDSGTTDCLKGEAEHAGSNVDHTNGAASPQPQFTRRMAAGVAHEAADAAHDAAGAEQEHAGRETRLQRDEDDDENEEASFLKSRDDTSRHADRETCLHRDEVDDLDDEDEEASFLESRDDTSRHADRETCLHRDEVDDLDDEDEEASFLESRDDTSRHADRETCLHRDEVDDLDDEDEEASFLESRDDTSRHADRETCLHGDEDDDPDDEDEEASFLESRDDTSTRNGRRFEWRRRQWRQRRRCRWQDDYSEEDDDDMRSASTSGVRHVEGFLGRPVASASPRRVVGDTTPPDGWRSGDHGPATTTATPAERRRRAGYRLSGRWVRPCGSGSEKESSGGWRSAPEVGHGGGSYRANREGFGGGAVGGGAGWRSRGVLGRRPASREAARQLRVSERMHRLGRAMAKRKEATRQRRDEVQRAREELACSGRLNLCSKTRELTDNQPKYVYRRPNGKSGASNGGSGYGGGVSDSSGREGVAAERGEPGIARGGEQESRGGGALYRGAGDRLYSEWMATRKRNASLLAKAKSAAAEREDASPEGWTCPECGAGNRAQDDTCQTFTGLAVAAQDLRPDTWCRESPEALGRVAATASAAAAVAAAAATATRSTAVKPGGATGDQRGPESRRRYGGGGSSDSRRVGEDGVRRCGRRRPEMFRPTPVARPLDHGVVRARPKGEATCTFAPEINELSRRLAEAREARRDLLDFVRAGSESDGSGGGGGGGGKGGSERKDTPAATRGGGGAGAARSKIMVKSYRLHADHADIEQRRERRRKELLSQSCPFTPDIGVSAAWPIQETTKEDFVRRLHAEHAEQERRLQAKRYT
ncbi:unnamed protein product [Ectocarpus sp. CCAP 1310/34]|nr:unnamed protein product [Ectocarpus sp. CCAP 1310/34]